MAVVNKIELAQLYKAIVDKAFMQSSLTAPLEVEKRYIQDTDQAEVVKIMERTLQGLGDYSRSTGFKQGTIEAKWVPYTIRFDRGRTFSLDVMDDWESLSVIGGSMLADLVAEYVVPEIDALRFATMADRAGLDDASALSSSNIVEKIRNAERKLNDAKVPKDGRILYLSTEAAEMLDTATGVNLRRTLTPAQSIDTRVMDLNGMPIIEVSSDLFYDKFDTLNGVDDEEEGGVIPSPDAKPLNFLIVYKGSVNTITRHTASRIFFPNENQQLDATRVDYRIYHDLIVPNNKRKGVFVHKKA